MFVATKKGRAKKSPPLFVAVVGFGIQIRDGYTT
jgi:hypothetical protein